MVASTFALSWIWILLFAGGGSIPLGGAPLPLDPVLSAIAPEEALWYAGYAGQGPASAESDNQTEQLLAEPQVVRFTEEVQSQLLRLVRRVGGPDREKRVVAEQAPKLLRALLTRPSAAYVESLELSNDGPPAIEAALILHAGDQRASIEASLAELQKLVPADRPLFKAETVAGVEWQRAANSPAASPIRWGWKDDYLIVAIGASTPEKLLARMSGSAPAWLTKIRDEHPIERELSIAYLNVAGVLKTIQPTVERRQPPVWPALEKLGLTSVLAIHGRSGYDAVGCRTLAHIVTDGSRPGLLGLLPYRPLAKDDLALIPKSSLTAIAVSLDAGELWDHAHKLVIAFDPAAQERSDRALWEVETRLGVNVREDIVAALGDAWVAYLPSGDLMTSWIGAATAVKVADAPTLRTAVDKLVDAAEAELAGRPRGVKITKTTLVEQQLYSLQLPGPAPISPTWAVGDEWLVFGLSPQAVRTALERSPDDSLGVVAVPDDSLADQASVAAALDAEGGASLIAYQDTPQLVRSVYPWLQIGIQMASGKLREQGVAFDPALLPSVDVVVKHLRPSVTAWSSRSDGFLIASEHSLPGEGNLAASAPLAMALAGFRNGALRGLPLHSRAAQNQDLNDLKQIALGALNHESARKRLPSNLKDKEGKPLLSWRVAILPYTEQYELYKEFHLDEPWDSPHNKALLPRMPEMYRSGDDPAGTTKTRYLAIAGNDGILAGDKARMIREIIDGTSNTLLTIQAAPDRAVEWTKPDDFQFDPAQPFAGLGTPSGTFLAGFSDGSCRPLSLGMSAEAMRAIATRAGEEVVDQNALNAPPAPEKHRPQPVGAP